MTPRLSNPARHKRRVAVDAVMVFVIVLLLVQMWLLTATLESYLAGHHDVALPGFLTSLAVFIVTTALYVLIRRLDRAPEPDERPSAAGPWRLS